MKGDGMQNGGTLVVEKGEMSFPSVSISLLSLAVFSLASSSIIICFRHHWEKSSALPPALHHHHPTPTSTAPHREMKQFRRNEFC